MKKSILCFLLVICLTVPAAALEGDSSRAAARMAAYGAITASESGYNVDGFCTRAQALTMLGRLGNYTGKTKPYSDVPAWAREAVSGLHQAGLLQDIYPGSTLQSGEYINAEEWSALLLRISGIPTEKKGAAAYARRLGVVSRSYSNPLTRGEAFEMACDALSHRQNGVTLAQKLGKEPMGASLMTARQVADAMSSAVMELHIYPSQSAYEKGTMRTDGSAFFLSADGIAVTNYHVLKKGEMGVAVLSTGEEFPIEGVLWGDKAADLAVIRIGKTSVDKTVTTPAFAAVNAVGAEEARPGDKVYAIGNPLGLGLSVSEGLVSATGRSCGVSSLPCLVNTAAISNGSSGGALFNEFGNVIAVTAGSFTDGNEMYIAIPVDSLLEQDYSAMKCVPLADAMK